MVQTNNTVQTRECNQGCLIGGEGGEGGGEKGEEKRGWGVPPLRYDPSLLCTAVPKGTAFIESRAARRLPQGVGLRNHKTRIPFDRPPLPTDGEAPG